MARAVPFAEEDNHAGPPLSQARTTRRTRQHGVALPTSYDAPMAGPAARGRLRRPAVAGWPPAMEFIAAR